ncbi:hypothetical protein EG68_06913 [Paragonimus skrjabini miyazakii]|uniref:Uncharacterized protein n=1 Tax=Paragonimus skrjabini miyazakii TaxID=59628 RepID=A0A8S9YZW8_9TREM|nr:hypothetical protein EG68_06913 [Paragonimus skrjabini miyazakii]
MASLSQLEEIDSKRICTVYPKPSSVATEVFDLAPDGRCGDTENYDYHWNFYFRRTLSPSVSTLLKAGLRV